MTSEQTCEQKARDDTARTPFSSTQVLTTILRLFGAVVLVSSLSIFLFQGWSAGDGINRFLSLIGFSGLLTAAGFVCANAIGEKIGARFFLGIALISVAVNFSVAGSLIYSTLVGAYIPNTLPQFAIWQLTSDVPVIVFAIAALFVLSPIATLAFRALSRKSSNSVFGIFMGSNLFLLLPIRDTNVVTGLGVIALIVCLRKLFRLTRGDAALATIEGRFALAVSVLPLLIAIGRSMLFYEHTSLALALVLTMVYAATRYVGIISQFNRWIVTAVDFASVASGFMAAVFYGVFVDEYFPSLAVLQIPLFSALLSTVLIEMSFHSTLPSRVLRVIAAAVLGIGFALNLAIHPSYVLALVNTLVGVCILSFGVNAQQRLMFLTGLLTSTIGVVYQFILISQWFYFGNWLTLALLGVAIILLASVLERHGGVLVNRISTWYRGYRAWQN